MEHIKRYLEDVSKISLMLNFEEVKKAVELLKETREKEGRVFIIGVGGSAANASHVVNDFRKIAGIETYAPTDNVSELTARTNDEGWPSVFVEWLKVSRLNSKDLILVLSVGGGNLEKNISPNIVEALQLAKAVNAKIVGIVSKDGGYTKQVADSCILIPPINEKAITPYAESFQAVIWHMIVSHPDLQRKAMKWESVTK